MSKEKTAAILIIGNEILSGRTNDKNINFLAQQLGIIGINLYEVRIVRDDEKQIISNLDFLSKNYDYVFSTGGIGPTHDDITAESVAKTFKTEIELNQQAHEILKKHYGEKLNQARLKMALIPKGATLLNNKISSAPGFKINNVFVYAGVPKIMQVMFEASKEFLETGPIKKSKSIESYVTEGEIAHIIAEIQDKFKDVEIGSYPFIHNEKLATAIVFRSLNEKSIELSSAEYKYFLDKKEKKLINN